MSVNSLAEYLLASPSRRKTILHEQKYPKPFQAAFYEESSKAITAVLTGTASADSLSALADGLRRRTESNAWSLTRNNSNAEALEAFGELLDEGSLDGYEFRRTGRGQATISIAGVEISIRPELRTVSSSGVGMVKLFFSKPRELGPDGGSYTGALCYSFACSTLDESERVRRDHCLVIDVFHKESFEAPQSFKRRLSDVEAACEEIALRWKFL